MAKTKVSEHKYGRIPERYISKLIKPYTSDMGEMLCLICGIEAGWGGCDNPYCKKCMLSIERIAELKKQHREEV